ncbi:hypothetical protein Tco_1071778, partial [Tanacetum coccineum]
DQVEAARTASAYVHDVEVIDVSEPVHRRLRKWYLKRKWNNGEDAMYLAYALSSSQSDWVTVKVMQIL